MFGGNPGVHQLRPQLFKSSRVLLALRLGLKQGNGADVLSAILIGYHLVYFWSTKASKGRMVTAPSGALPG